MNNTHEYDDIIDLKRPDTGRHPHMSVENRAAQFSPFAALTGFDAAIDDMAQETTKTVLASEEGESFEEAP